MNNLAFVYYIAMFHDNVTSLCIIATHDCTHVGAQKTKTNPLHLLYKTKNM